MYINSHWNLLVNNMNRIDNVMVNGRYTRSKYNDRGVRCSDAKSDNHLVINTKSKAKVLKTQKIFSKNKNKKKQKKQDDGKITEYAEKFRREIRNRFQQLSDEVNNFSKKVNTCERDKHVLRNNRKFLRLNKHSKFYI